MGQAESSEQTARVSTEELSRQLAERFATKCFTPLELTHFKDIFRSLAEDRDGIRYWKEETLRRFLVIPDALGPGPVLYQSATYLGAFPFASQAPVILTLEALLKVVVIMTQRYEKVLKGGKKDRNKLLYRSIAVFDRKMSSNPASSISIAENERDSGAKNNATKLPVHPATFSVDAPGDDEEDEDDEELALAALDSLDAIEVYKTNERENTDTNIHHALVPPDNLHRLIMFLLVIAPLTPQEPLSGYAQALTEERLEHLRRLADSVLWAFMPEHSAGISYSTWTSVIPVSLPYLFDGLNPLFEHFLFSKNIDLSKHKRSTSIPSQPSSATKPAHEVASSDAPSIVIEPVLQQLGEILNPAVLSQLSFFIPGRDLFRRLRLLYSASTAGFSTSSFSQKVENWRAPTILLVGGTRISSSNPSTREKAFLDHLPHTKFPPGNAGNSSSQRVVFGTFLRTPWKQTHKEPIGDASTLLFQLEPVHEVFHASQLNRDYATFTPHTGVSFGCPVPKTSAVSGPMSSTAALGAVSLHLEESFEFGVFTHDSAGGGAFGTSRTRRSDWQERFEIESLEVWGCGGSEEAESQRKRWEWEEKEAKSRRGLNRRDTETDYAILEMAGLVGKYGQSGGSMG